MRELFDTQLNLDDKPMSADDLALAMQQTDVLASTITDRIDAPFWPEPVHIKLIANFGVGVDHI